MTTLNEFMHGLEPETRDTPFLKFWAAINEQIAERGLPELSPARSLWLETLERARFAVLRAI